MTIDLTQIINEAVVGLLGLVGTVFLAWLSSHMKDKQAALVIGNAVKNSLGAMQIAATEGVKNLHPQVTIPVSPIMAAGIGYVLDHATTELARFPGITESEIRDKITAQVGLANIGTNLATAASPAPSPRPLDPVNPPERKTP